MESWRWRTAFHSNIDWCARWLLVYYNIHQNTIQERDGTRGPRRARGAFDPHDGRRRTSAGGHVLVRMDLESPYNLGATGYFRWVFRSWNPLNILASMCPSGPNPRYQT